QPRGTAAQSTQLRLSSPGGKPTTQVTLFDQGLVQVLQAAVTGLEPEKSYVLALATQPDGGGKLEAIASFTTNPAGAAIVNTVGPDPPGGRSLDSRNSTLFGDCTWLT